MTATSSSTALPAKTPRPAPSRTLKQPQSLDVATNESKASSVGDSDMLRTSLESKASIQRQALNWMERLCEEVLAREEFKEACSYIPPSLYDSILHERHLFSMCSYPACPNPPMKPYRAFPTPRSRIIRSPLDGSKRIVEVEGNSEDGFCSRVCARRSEWVSRSGILAVEGAWLRKSGGGEAGGAEEQLELLEEVEEKKALAQGRQAEEREEAKNVETLEPPLFESREQPPEAPPSGGLPDTASPSTLAPSPALSKVPQIQSLLSTLQIQERPTPTDVPIPPSFSPTPPPPRSSTFPPASSSPSSSTPAPHSQAAIREREALRRQDASASALVPGSIGRVGEVVSAGTKKAGQAFRRTRIKAEADGVAEDGQEDDNDDGDEEEEEEELDELDDEWRLMDQAREELDGGSGLES